MVAQQFGIYLVNLDPTIGAEIQKTRPCMIISPKEMNKYLATVIIVPLTSTLRSYPTRINCLFDGKKGQLALDQMRAVDNTQLIKQIGIFEDPLFQETLLELVREMFAYRAV